MDTPRAVNESNPGYEKRDADIRALLIFGAVLAATLVLIFVLMLGVFRHFSRVQSLGPPASPFADSRALPPQPRLQLEPRMELEHLRQREDDILNSYGWVDPSAGIVRIPIDRAMTLLLEKGLPVRNVQPEKK